MCNSLFIIVFAASLLMSSFAAPLKDVHKTHVQMLELSPKHNSQKEIEQSHILVSIDRLDKLYTEGHELIGTRIQHILLSYNLDPVGTLTMNDVVVPLGKSSASMTVKTVESVLAHSKKEANDLMNKFDRGVLSVEIDAVGEQFVHNGILVRRMAIALRLLELNGRKLESHESIVQVLETRPDGFVSSKPYVSSMSAQNALRKHSDFKYYTHSKNSKHSNGMNSSVAHTIDSVISWWNVQSTWSKILLYSSLSVLILSIIVGLIAFWIYVTHKLKARHGSNLSTIKYMRAAKNDVKIFTKTIPDEEHVQLIVDDLPSYETEE